MEASKPQRLATGRPSRRWRFCPWHSLAPAFLPSGCSRLRDQRCWTRQSRRSSSPAGSFSARQARSFCRAQAANVRISEPSRCERHGTFLAPTFSSVRKMQSAHAERLVTALHADAAAMHEEEAAGCARVECSHCGRHFLEARLARHQAVCQGRKKAKVQPAKLQQSEAQQEAQQSEALRRAKQLKHNLAQSEALRQAIKSARTPGDPPAPAEEAPDDRVECPHCSRRFAPGPAERHIAKCEEIRAKPTTLKRMSMAPRLVQKEKEAGDKVLSPPPPPPPLSPLRLRLHLHHPLILSFVLSIHRSFHHHGSRCQAQRRPSKAPRRRRDPPRQSRPLFARPRAHRRRRRRRRLPRPGRLAPPPSRLRRPRRPRR